MKTFEDFESIYVVNKRYMMIHVSVYIHMSYTYIYIHRNTLLVSIHTRLDICRSIDLGSGHSTSRIMSIVSATIVMQKIDGWWMYVVIHVFNLCLLHTFVHALNFAPRRCRSQPMVSWGDIKRWDCVSSIENHRKPVWQDMSDMWVRLVRLILNFLNLHLDSAMNSSKWH